MSWRLKELAERVGVSVVGDADSRIDSVASLQNAGPGSITFLADIRYKQYLMRTRASAVIATKADAADCPTAVLISDNPYLTFAKIVVLLHPQLPVAPGIHATAVVAPDCQIDPSVAIGPQTVIESGAIIGPDVVIGPGCIVGQGSLIGASCRLVARVTLCRRAVLGRRVIVHPGAVIGSDGFGLAKSDGAWVKIPQLGRAVVGDDVEIGANTTIDCGTLEDTVLEDGVKLDNQIQIAHNVHIGAHTAIAGCVGIAGSTDIGRNCTIGGAAMIIGHIRIVDDVHVSGGTFISRSILKPGTYTGIYPFDEHAAWARSAAIMRRLGKGKKNG